MGPLFGATSGVPSVSATNYTSINSSLTNTWNSTYAARSTIVTEAFTLTGLYVLLTAPPNTGKSYTFTVYKNGVATALTLTISGAAVTNTDSTHSVTFAAGDTIALASVSPSGTPDATGIMYWNLITDDAGVAAFPITGTNGTSASASATQYAGLFSVNSSGGWKTTESDIAAVMPTAGVIKNLYVGSQVVPGTAASGKSYKLTLYKNGVAQALTATILDAATAANDTNGAHAVTYAAGDTISIEVVPTATPTATRLFWGMSWYPTVAGESFIAFGNTNVPGATTTQYEQPFGVGANGYNSTENLRYSVPGAWRFKNIYQKLGTAPGGSTSRASTLRKNAASTALALTITGAATTGNAAADADFAQGDFMGMMFVPTSSPAVLTGGVHMGMVMTAIPVTPPATHKKDFFNGFL